MKRLFGLLVVSVALLAACGGGETAPDAETPPPALPNSAPDLTVLPPEPPEADRIGATMLSCGGEQFRVAFTDAGATQVNDDGSNTDLPLLPAGPDTEPGVSVTATGGSASRRRAAATHPRKSASPAAAWRGWTAPSHRTEVGEIADPHLSSP